MQRKIDFSESMMNKKILGVKIGTILTVLGSLAFAVLFWLMVKYAGSSASSAMIISAF